MLKKITLALGLLTVMTITTTGMIQPAVADSAPKAGEDRAPGKGDRPRPKPTPGPREGGEE